MILSATMMLDHIGENGLAETIRKAVSSVVVDGDVRTYDMSKLSGGQGVVDQGAAPTTVLTDAIIAALDR